MSIRRLMMATILASTAVWAQESAQMVETDAATRTALFAAAASDFRDKASDRPKEAVEAYFVSANSSMQGGGELATRGKWKRDVEIRLLLGKEVLADFFTGAILLSGPTRTRGGATKAMSSEGIVGLYNPWWDAMLLLHMATREVHPDFVMPEAPSLSVTPAVVVKDFKFISGETFRGESVEKDAVAIRRTTVIPEDDPISAEVWRVTAATVKQFERVLPLEGKRVSFGGCGAAVMCPDYELESRRLALRAGLRLKLSLALLKNSQAFGIGIHVQKMARNGSLFQLYSYFREPESRKLLSQFSELPSEFRKDFVLYGYVPTKEATLYVLVNKKFSRLYVTATVPTDVPKTPASFEWYDLDKADEMIELWNNRAEKKEVEK